MSGAKTVALSVTFINESVVILQWTVQGCSVEGCTECDCTGMLCGGV